MQGKMCRISKKRLWRGLDTKTVETEIKYGSTMKKRRDQKKDRTLDLHGVLHVNADDEIRKFFNFADLPVTVITGRSARMREILFKITEEYGWKILDCVSNTAQFTITD